MRTAKSVGDKKGANVLVFGHICYRCGHQWLPHDINVLPKACPKCKSAYWDRPRKERKK